MYGFPDLYVIVQLRQDALDESAGRLRGFRELPIVPSFEISGNGRDVEFEPLGGLLKRGLVQELVNGFPLSRGDLGNQRIVQAVAQTASLVDLLVV